MITRILILLSFLTVQVFAQTAVGPTIIDGVGIWGEPGGIPASPNFALTVKGRAVQVRDWSTTTTATGTQRIHVARFCTTGAWNASLTANQTITSATIRPRSRGISVSGLGTRTISFNVSGPEKLYIQINSLPPVCIFATPVISLPPAGANVRVLGGGIQNLGTLNIAAGQTIWLNPSCVLRGRIASSNISNARIAGYGIIENTDTVTSNAILFDGGGGNTVDGVFVKHSGRGWSILMRHLTSGGVRNASVLSFNENNDGIDLGSCSNVRVENCFVRTVDDCISIKNARTGISSTGNVITGCTCYGYINGDGITIGHENDGNINNVNVTNCDIIGASGSSNAPSGLHSAFSVIALGAGGVNTCTFDNIRCEDLVTVNNFECGVRLVSGGTSGYISNITVKNITWANDRPVTFTSLSPSNRVTTVPMTNCRIAGRTLTATDPRLRTTANVQNVTVNGVAVASPR
jgi:Glycosyl hydrolases family 28